LASREIINLSQGNATYRNKNSTPMVIIMEAIDGSLILAKVDENYVHTIM